MKDPARFTPPCCDPALFGPAPAFPFIPRRELEESAPVGHAAWHDFHAGTVAESATSFDRPDREHGTVTRTMRWVVLVVAFSATVLALSGCVSVKTTTLPDSWQAALRNSPKVPGGAMYGPIPIGGVYATDNWQRFEPASPSPGAAVGKP